MKSNSIYVFGHKNPDADSVCAAIALSYLKRALGYSTIPAVLGDINTETKFALDYFKFDTPMHLNDVKVQIRDIDYHRNSYIDKNCTIKDAFDYMNKHNLTGLPVVENRNKYCGYISLKEIASAVINGDFHKIETSYGNLLSLLRGTKVLKFDKEITGKVIAASNAHDTFLENAKLDNNCILIIGDRNEIIKYAIESKVKLIILIAGASINDKLLENAKKNRVNIIKTHLSSYEVGKLISLSNYIKGPMKSDETDPMVFRDIDYLSDFLEKTKNSKHTNYPIVNSMNECSGVLALTDTNQINRKKVILVDHNNTYQSVDGLEEAEILEIIDHHNLGDIVTNKPINFRNSLCGCVSTIIYEMFNENNIKIPSNIAGLLASAIISDTLLLTSPTTTNRDAVALKALCKIAKIDQNIYGTEFLKHAMGIKGLKNEELLYRDFKSYKADDNSFGIGQLLIPDYKSIKRKINNIVEFLNEEAHNQKYKVLTLFVTDIFEGKSYCLYNKEAEEIIKNAFHLNDIYEGVILDGVLSRKIQIVPYIMDALSK